MKKSSESIRNDELVTALRRAASAIPEGLGAEPAHLGLRQGLALAMRHAGDPEGADAQFARLLDLQPRNTKAWQARIDMALAGKDVTAADALVRQAQDNLPKDAAILVRRAKVLQRLGRTEEARKAIGAIRALAPGDPGIALQLAKLLKDIGNLAGADGAYLEVLTAYPENLEALRGRIELALAQDTPEIALRRCESALVLFPKDVKLRDRKVYLLQRSGRPQEAAAMLRAQLEQKPKSVGLRVRLANLLRSLGEFRQAETLFDEVLDLSPDHAPALLGRIDVLHSSGDADRALAACAEFTERHGRSADVLRRQASVLRRIGRSGDALAILSEVCDLKADDHGLRLDLGYAQLEAGEYPAAETSFRTVLKALPDDRRALLGLVEAAEARGDLTTAMALLEGRIGEAGKTG